jgi:hypothetical protein
MTGAADITVSVFVPGLMGAGILLSGGILLADGIRRLIPLRGVRRRVTQAIAVHGIVEGAARAAGVEVPEHEVLPRRLRTRRAYGVTAAGLIVAGLGVTRLFLDAYADPYGSLHENPWAIGLAIATDAPLAFGVALSGSLAVVRRRLPPRVRRLVATSWLGRLSPPPEDAAERARTLMPWLGKDVSS